MEIYIIIGFVVFVIILKSIQNSSFNSSKKRVKNNIIYKYSAKNSLMTKAESDFFVKLERVAHEKYYVFPQVHLSAILDHHIDGQDWKHAFRHINGKSVDYVLCDKSTLKPVYAIELDDYTHDKPDRKVRDIEVERIFKATNLPLVRFKNKEIDENGIIQSLADANELMSMKLPS